MGKREIDEYDLTVAVCLASFPFILRWLAVMKEWPSWSQSLSLTVLISISLFAGVLMMSRTAEPEETVGESDIKPLGPPLPISGLPETWTMEQWGLYGHLWLEKQIQEATDAEYVKSQLVQDIDDMKKKGDSKLIMQDSVIGGDALVDSTKIEIHNHNYYRGHVAEDEEQLD